MLLLDKVIIIALIVGMVTALLLGWYFLYKDSPSSEGANLNRLMYTLGVRVTLAVTLIAFLVYLMYSGRVKIGAPWDNRHVMHGQHIEQRADDVQE